MDQTSHHDQEHDNRLAGALFLLVAVVLVLGVVCYALWGLAAITMIGLVATLAVFGMLIAYAAGL